MSKPRKKTSPSEARRIFSTTSLAVHYPGKAKPGQKVSLAMGGKSYKGHVIESIEDGRLRVSLKTPLPRRKMGVVELTDERRRVIREFRRVHKSLDRGEAKFYLDGKRVTVQSPAGVHEKAAGRLIRSKEPWKALESLEKVAELRPDDPEALLELADMHMLVPTKGGSKERAIDLYEQVLTMDPGNSEVKTRLRLAKGSK